MGLGVVVVVDDFDSGFVDFGCGDRWQWGCDCGCGCGCGFFFFFFSMLCCGCQSRVVVVVLVVAVADVGGGYGWCYGCFLGSGIYYFIVMFILFSCVES